MTLNQFLIAFAITFLTSSLPTAVLIYLAIRFALSHGDVSWRGKGSKKEG